MVLKEKVVKTTIKIIMQLKVELAVMKIIITTQTKHRSDAETKKRIQRKSLARRLRWRKPKKCEPPANCF